METTTPAPALLPPTTAPQPTPPQPSKSPMKTVGIFSLSIGIIVLGVMLYNSKQENQKYQLLTVINQAENRVLKDEIRSLERAADSKPSYEDGYKEALIRAGRPTNPGAYQDGYEAAMKIIDNGGYAEGYHAAIKQFGYQPNKSVAFIIDEPKKDAPKTINVIGK